MAAHPSNEGREKVSLQRRFLSIPSLISFAVAGLLILFLMTRFHVDLGGIWNTIRQGNLLLYFLAFPVHYLTFLFRGARWRILLRNTTEPGKPVPSGLHCGQLILLGWFANSIAWLRLGDAYRAYAYTQDTGASFPRTVGTVVAERVVDVTLAFSLFLVAALVISLRGGTIPFIAILLGLGLMGVAALVLLTMGVARRRVVHFLPGRLADAYHRFHQGTMGSFRQLPLVTLLGLLGWLAEVGRLYLVVQALDLDVAVAMVVLVAISNAFLTLFPFTPGGLVVVEGGVIGLLVLTLAREEAGAVVALDRSISYLSIIIIGGVIFAVRQTLRARHRKGQVEGVGGGS